MKTKRNPIKSGWSPAIIGENIAHELQRGKPHAEAIAIALQTARQAYRNEHPKSELPKHLEELPIAKAGFMYRKNPVKKKRVKFYLIVKRLSNKSLGHFSSKKKAIRVAQQYANRTGESVGIREGK